VFPIHIPPLRERRDDIPALVEHFLVQPHLAGVADLHLSKDVLRELHSRPWVGNVRELRNTIEHAAIVARGRPIQVEHLPPAATGTATGGTPDIREINERIARWTAQESRKEGVEPVETALYERFLELVEPPLLRAMLEQSRGNRAVAAEK